MGNTTSYFFDAFRGTGRIGFPLVQLEDGTYTTDLDGVLDSFGIAARMQFGK